MSSNHKIKSCDNQSQTARFCGTTVLVIRTNKTAAPRLFSLIAELKENYIYFIGFKKDFISGCSCIAVSNVLKRFDRGFVFCSSSRCWK